ncbi:hypothetical protein, partial [Rhizobium leguminosarum]|uniref:hypothetical protein n=1 Tax=Rhizobium leguminosarum TaxID=384 RepID=UPI003F964147
MGAYPLKEDTLFLSSGREHYLYCISTKNSVPFIPKSKFSEAENISVFLGGGEPANGFYFSNFWQGLYEYAQDGTIMKHYSGRATDDRKRLSHNGVNGLLQDNDSIFYVATFNGLS